MTTSKKGVPMRLRMLAWAGLLALLLALLSPTAALAQATTTTVHFSGSDSHPDINPCTGAPGTFSSTFEGVTHLTALPDGSYHQTTTKTLSFTFVPDDPNQPSYTGKLTGWFGGNLNQQNNYTLTVATHYTARGSDGSRITAHFVGHITITPDGTVTVFFENDRLTCP
jgi:hypothetical protein